MSPTSRLGPIGRFRLILSDCETNRYGSINRTTMNSSITAIVTAYRRIDQTLFTLEKIKECSPPPDEILVHVDGNQTEFANAVRRTFPEIKVLVSETNVGPGGGRNKLINAAANELVASFDDDSYPLDVDYFARLARTFANYRDAWIVTALVFERGVAQTPLANYGEWVADFSGGACAYRRDEFLRTGGYVPLPLAYGMEEVDLAIRLHARGGRVLRDRSLRVFHDTDLSHHNAPRITSASVRNLAMLTFLRYPLVLWPIGVAQLLNRVSWLTTHGRHAGLVSGLLSIPFIPFRYGYYRGPVSITTLLSYLKLRRNPVSFTFSVSQTFDTKSVDEHTESND
jgi:GT2 family glycosyltransferase